VTVTSGGRVLLPGVGNPVRVHLDSRVAAVDTDGPARISLDVLALEYPEAAAAAAGDAEARGDRVLSLWYERDSRGQLSASGIDSRGDRTEAVASRSLRD